jgi:hypothetical protein
MARPVSSTSPASDEIQVGLLRDAGTTGRFARARSLSRNVIALSRRAIRRRHPDWSEREVQIEFLAVHYGRDLAERVRDHLERRGP